MAERLLDADDHWLPRIGFSLIVEFLCGFVLIIAVVAGDEVVGVAARDFVCVRLSAVVTVCVVVMVARVDCRVLGVETEVCGGEAASVRRPPSEGGI